MRGYWECVYVFSERRSVVVGSTHNETEKAKECKKTEDRFVEKRREDDFIDTDS